ncbi:MAG: 4Fe-4S binding protein [Bacteroidaceae bacterium]|jgi:NADH-quinone oxidoreductase subunit I|nr:4Fe-4S binding protein [Bacteroidaceae bacterium]
METRNTYIGNIIHAAKSLLTGMRVTLREFFTRKITEQYPENRSTLHIPSRHRATLVMPHDADGNNKCIACGLCQQTCPNGTISITTKTVTDEETGKSRKVLAEYHYDLGACMFCQLCVNICPKGAIEFSNEFENAVFDRKKLIIKLNR